MRLAGVAHHILCYAVALLHWYRDTEAAKLYPTGPGDNGTKPKLSTYKAPNETELVADMSNLTLTAPTINDLIQVGRQLSLPDLDSLLTERRALAGDDPDNITEHYNTASIIMTYCPSLVDAKNAVQQALDTKLYEILRCLARHPIWKDKTQERWYWGMISETPAFNPDAWVDELRGMIFKADSIELYGMIRHAVSLDELSEEELCGYMIMFDSLDILNAHYQGMINKIATNVELMLEYEPPRITNFVQNSIIDTSHIAAHSVKSAKELHYLFTLDYDQIANACLFSNANILTVNPECAKWLAANNCLSLLQELFIGNPNSSYKYNDYLKAAVEQKSLDTATWLLSNTNVEPSLLATLMGYALIRGHSDTVKWLFESCRDQMDWNYLLHFYIHMVNYDFIINFLKNKTGLTPPHGFPNLKLLFLAVSNDLEGLKTAPPKTYRDCEQPANVATMCGHEHILEWLCNKYQYLPYSHIVVTACERGNYSALRWIFKVKPSQIIHGYNLESYIDASKCLLAAAMQNNQEEMKWIWNNLLKDGEPQRRGVYEIHYDLSEQLTAIIFNQIIKSTNDLDPNMLGHAVSGGDVQMFQWLCDKGMSIPVTMAVNAIRMDRFEVIKRIHVKDPSLLCAEKVFSDIKNSQSVWRYNIWSLIEKTCPNLPANDKGFNEWKANHPKQQKSLPK